MALFSPCPDWEYKDHGAYPGDLQARCSEMVQKLEAGALDAVEFCSDTRSAHATLLRDLTPAGFAYYAGNYRGSAFPCLRNYPVTAGGDPAVGAPPSSVAHLMGEFAARVRAASASLDALHADEGVSRRTKLSESARIACILFELFLRIHPYVNGNGHIARLIVVAMLARHGYRLQRWTVEPSPTAVPYLKMIIEQRRGNPDYCPTELIKMVLRA